MAWDFETDPEFAAELDWMRQFVREEIIPLELLDLTYEQLLEAIAPLQETVKERGLWATHLGPELGGPGFGQVKLALMHEILGECLYAPLAFGNNAPDSGNAELIAIAARDDAQREKWLHPLLTGNVRSGFSMTEPGAGADPTLLTTTAVRDGDEWVINGHKWYTSNGSISSFLIVMAVTNPDVPAHKGCSMILVPADTPGVDFVRDVPTMEHPEELFGTYNSHAEIIYRDVRVPYENLLGAEGDGFVLAQKRLGPGRVHHAMRWLGQSNRAFDMLCERAVTRYVHGSLLGQKQTIQNWIADSKIELTQVRLLTLYTAWKMDRDGAPASRDEIAMIKVAGATALYNVVDRAIQIHGGLGFSTDLPLEAMYRKARGARILDGPDEVHRMSLARRILKQYEPSDPPREHIPTRRKEAVARFADLLEHFAAQE